MNSQIAAARNDGNISKKFIELLPQLKAKFFEFAESFLPLYWRLQMFAQKKALTLSRIVNARKLSNRSLKKLMNNPHHTHLDSKQNVQQVISRSWIFDSNAITFIWLNDVSRVAECLWWYERFEHCEICSKILVSCEKIWKAGKRTEKNPLFLSRFMNQEAFVVNDSV